jgi:hypothetical protein
MIGAYEGEACNTVLSESNISHAINALEKRQPVEIQITPRVPDNHALFLSLTSRICFFIHFPSWSLTQTLVVSYNIIAAW